MPSTSRTTSRPINVTGSKGPEILVASYEGVSLLTRPDGKWEIAHLGEGDQAKPNTNRGSSEIKLGKLKSGTRFIATIEPWHGNQVVVYTQPAGGKRLEAAGARQPAHVGPRRLVCRPGRRWRR